MRLPSSAVRKRFFSAAIQGVRTTWRAIFLVLVSFFHQVTGLFFLFFVSLGAAGIWKEYQALNGNAWNAKMWVAVIFTVIFTGFAIQSFRKAAEVGKR